MLKSGVDWMIEILYNDKKDCEGSDKTREELRRETEADTFDGDNASVSADTLLARIAELEQRLSSQKEMEEEKNGNSKSDLSDSE